MSVDPKLDAQLQKWGAELEAAYQKQGTPLPEGLSGEDLVRGALEEMEKGATSAALQARAKRITEVAKQVAAELSGGVNHPDFQEHLMNRVAKLFESDDPGPAASA